MQSPENKNIDFLWRSFLRGDDKCFTIIYEQYIERLFSYGYKLCSDNEMVRDCIQEIFIDLFLKRKKVSIEIGNLKSYLFIALRNCLTKKIVKKRRLKSLVIDADEEEIFFNIEYSFPGTATDQKISTEVIERLRDAINNLPSRQKEIIYLKFEEEIDYAGIAKIMKISVESSRKLLYRALVTLRKTVDSTVIQNLFLVFIK